MYEAYRELRTVKHTVNKHIVKLDLDLDIFGALCPSKSGLMNKHIVKHIVRIETLGRDANLAQINDQSLDNFCPHRLWRNVEIKPFDNHPLTVEKIIRF